MRYYHAILLVDAVDAVSGRKMNLTFVIPEGCNVYLLQFNVVVVVVVLKLIFTNSFFWSCCYHKTSVY